MADERQDGGPAFARSVCNWTTTRDEIRPENGMALRDFFASAVMAALIQGHKTVSIAPVLFAREAKLAYAAADAMLAARAR